jgi:CubicO group peptidase (beta-lactamase class C family)
MRAGTRWNYEEDESKICDVSDYRTHARRDIPTDTAAWIRSIDNSHAHGGPFRYVSLVSDVLGWVLERAGGGRFGQMCLQAGAFAGRQVVPAECFGRLRVRDPELIEAFADSPEYDPAKPDAFYHDAWWIYDAARGIYSGLGINGQALLVHHPTRSVVVKFSSHPSFEDRRLFALQEAGMLALCGLAASG